MKKIILLFVLISISMNSQVLDKQFDTELINSFYDTVLPGTKHIGIPLFSSQGTTYIINIYNEDYSLYKTVSINRDVYSSSEIDFEDRILISDDIFNGDALIEIGYFTNNGDFYVINEDGDPIFSVLGQNLDKEYLLYEKFDGQSTFFLSLSSQTNGTLIYKLPGNGTLGLRDNNQIDNSLKVYPNPSSKNVINITYDSSIVSGKVVFKIFDSKGSELQIPFNKTNKMYQFNTKNMNAGTYFIVMINQEQMTTKKIVVQ